MNTTTEHNILAAFDEAIGKLERMRDAINYAGSATDGWELIGPSSITIGLIQFTRPYDAESPNRHDMSADPRVIARVIGENWERLGNRWDGTLIGMPSVKVILHDAEDCHPDPVKVQL